MPSMMGVYARGRTRPATGDGGVCVLGDTVSHAQGVALAPTFQRTMHTLRRGIRFLL